MLLAACEHAVVGDDGERCDDAAAGGDCWCSSSGCGVDADDDYFERTVAAAVVVVVVVD